VIGQGAGVAAALSNKSNRELEDIDIGSIQRELERQDSRVH
jgi:hypothetical protein